MQQHHQYRKIKDLVHPNLNTSDLEKIHNYCEKNQVRFVDEEFPPEMQSLVDPKRTQNYTSQFDRLEWKNATQIFGKNNYKLFNKIEPQDIRQGSLGDCYFLCALSSLAEYPSLISRLFDFDSINQYGIQSVWLHINGVWQRYVLDEYFPAIDHGNKYDLAFSRTDQNELWVQFLEKAYAKAYGSYWDIVGGDPVHALRDLTGAPYDRIEDFDNLDESWSQMKEANAKQFMMTCFTHQGRTTEEKSQTGIVSGHAYTILDVRNIIDSRGDPRRVVQIRNPWGKFEWNGDFSDDSDLWSREDRQQLNIQSKDDGIFWMPLEEFVKVFQGIGILEIIPGAIGNGMTIEQQQSNKSIARLSLPQETNLTISIDQIDSRIIDNDDYSYSYFRVTIGRLVDGKGLEFVDSVLSPERNIFLENTLQQGDYMILVEAYWIGNFTRKFNIGSYSDYAVEIELIKSNTTLYDSSEYLIWKDFGKKYYDKMESKQDRIASNGQQQVNIKSYQFQNKKFASILYNYINTDNNLSLHTTLQYSKMKGFDVVGQSTSRNGANLVINPQDNDILLFKMDPRNKNGFQLSHRIIEDELIPYKFNEDKRQIEFLNALGGSQPIPSNMNNGMVSRLKKKEQVQQMRERNRDMDMQRQRAIEERKRLIALKKKRLQEEMLQQQKQLRSSGKGGLLGKFGKFLEIYLGNLQVLEV